LIVTVFTIFHIEGRRQTMKRKLRRSVSASTKKPISPLHPHVECFTRNLVGQGYSQDGVAYRHRLLTGLDPWLLQQGLNLRDLSEERIEQFLRDRHEQYSAQIADKPVLQAFLAYLRSEKVVPHAVAKRTKNPIDRLQRSFAAYLAEERGVKESTQRQYLDVTRSFLSRCSGNVESLSAQDVAKFILNRAEVISPNSAQRATTALRNFFQFLYQQGHVEVDLRASVPTVANWRLSGVPQHLSTDKIESLLKQCDQDSAIGQRDYAMLLLLARLGLRAGEVIHLTLDDIDWHNSEITIRGKGNRGDRLPIPQDVGQALVRYLRQTRPLCASRRVFIRLRAPHQGLVHSSTVSSIVHHALQRAGLTPTGAHVLRHSLASRMLRGGACLTEIGKVLRHQLVRTTAIYAKVDLCNLRMLAHPWPGGK